MLNRFFSEFCSPVVATVTSAEAEAVCLKNNLLLHELLSAFGHLDAINSSIRSGSQTLPVTDAHIRFERASELRAKSSNNVEELLRSSFEEFDLQRLPSTISDLKAAPPSGWSSNIEQLVMRSMSFSEFEMISHPLILLTVVATSDVEPVACMQELATHHSHLPQCLTSGQYDPDIHRVYLILHDVSAAGAFDPTAVLRKMQSKFPPTHVQLLALNSLPLDAPNLQQPDMWSRWKIPMFFPQLAPCVDPSIEPPKNPVNGVPVLGSRLSMEDFMATRDFCVSLYHQEVLPCLERRIAFLTKQVNEARKGMKNVLKSFWRKPREETGSSKGLRYRSDRIETQILLLADTAFIIKDYDMASQMYKLVRDDYKSDKSQTHLAHVTLMLAACHLLTEQGTGRGKDLLQHLESLGQVLQTANDPPHAIAYFALLAGEMYVCHHATRTPLDAAHMLLAAAASVPRYSLLCGLLTERAAGFFLQAGQLRRFAFHEMLAGHKIHSVGGRPRLHSATCFASAMLTYDRGRWGDIKVKLCRALAEDLKMSGREGAQRALVLMLRILASVLSDTSSSSHAKGGKGSSSSGGLSQGEHFASIADAIAVLREIMDEGPWGSVCVNEGWASSSTRELLLGQTSVSPPPVAPSGTLTEVFGLDVPEMDRRQLAIMLPSNGMKALVAHDAIASPGTEMAEEMRILLTVEKQWCLEQELEQESSGASAQAFAAAVALGGEKNTLAERWVAAESDLLEVRSGGMPRSSAQFAVPALPRIPLGELVVLRMHLRNKLPVDLSLTGLQLQIDESTDASKFDLSSLDLHLAPGMTKEVYLSALPKEVGIYRAETAAWNLSDVLRIKQPLKKPGLLLQKTMQQRSNRERGPQIPMAFEVIDAHPLLRVSFDGLSQEVLQGQLLRTTLLLINEGAATACDIDIKFSQACCCLLSSTDGNIISPWGQSATLARLKEVTIRPGEELRLNAWLRLTTLGRQQMSILTSYSALSDGSNGGKGGEAVPLGPGPRCRTSFFSVQINVLASVSLSMRVMDRPTSTKQRALVVLLNNNLACDDENEVGSGGGGRNASRRRGSDGQIDLDVSLVPSDYADLAEGCCKVEGIWVMGAVIPAPLHEEQQGHAMPLVMSPTERLTLCLPIELIEASKGGDAGKASWLLPLPSSLGCSRNSGNSYAEQENIPNLITRFLCGECNNEQFQRQLQKERAIASMESADAASAGPRTVQQVRRDRAKEQLANGEDESNGNAKQGAGAAAPSSSSSSSSQKLPSTAEDLASIESAKSSATITVVWVCRWQGKIRRGMQSVSRLSLCNSLTSASSPPLISKSPADLLLVGLTHPRQAVLDAQKRLVRVAVVMLLRSVSDEPLLVTIEAQDHKESYASSSSSAVHDSATPDSPFQGLRWEGKTKYVQVEVAPHATTSLNFRAVLSRTGVFDLKRFRVSVTSKKANKAYQKLLLEQSLLEVS